MIENLYIVLINLYIIIQVWAFFGLIHRIVKLGVSLKALRESIIVFLPFIGTVIYFKSKERARI